MTNKPLETLSENRGALRHACVGKGMGNSIPPSRKRIVKVYGLCMLLTIVLFLLQLVMIFDVAGEVLHYKTWLRETLGPKNAGKLMVLGCFFALMVVHASQAALWGIFLYRTRLLSSITEGAYFAGASVTTLGYGDILLKYPWRHIGTLIAISGVLMFGCSTAFLFLILQDVWQHS